MKDAKRLLMGGLLTVLLACDNVKVKTNTPTAAAVTVLRLFDAKDSSNKWNETVDPALQRIQARKSACIEESIANKRCGLEIARYQDDLARGRRGLSKECEGLPSTKQCTCGPKGQQTVTSSKPFTESDLYRRLAMLGISRQNCEVSDAQTTLDQEDLAKLLPDLPDLACQDVTSSDKFGVATLSCSASTGGTAVSMKLVLRNNPGRGWLFFAIDAKSEALLTLSERGPSSPAGAAPAPER